MIFKEAKMMASCRHQNLVPLVGIRDLSNEIGVVSQYMPHGNLLNYVKNNKICITATHVINWSLQIAEVRKSIYVWNLCMVETYFFEGRRIT